MTRVISVNWQDKTKEVITALELHNSSNYLKIILENYFLYNSYARDDIARILKEKWDLLKKEPQPRMAVLKNIFLEIYSKYIQVTEDLALVGIILLRQSKTFSPVQIYMEGTNSDILGFYKTAHKGFSDTEIAKIMGVDKLRHYIKSAQQLSPEEVQGYNYIIDESIKIERNNLNMLAKIYIEESKNEAGKIILEQAGPIDVYNGIKHGFKLVHPTKLTKAIWKSTKDESVEVMHQVLLDKSTGQKIVGVGGFESITDNLIDHIMYNIACFSDSLHNICEVRLWVDKDPMYVIKRFRLTKSEEELKKCKVGVNEKCPCGSGIKYKKCCKKFKYDYEKSDPYSLVDF